MKYAGLLLMAGLVLTVASLLPAHRAAADKVYHSQHIPLTSANDSPLKKGFVENIHPNGPQIFARERYVLIGATPDTTYQVTLFIYLESPTCVNEPVVLPTATLETGAAGNGAAQAVIRPAEVPPPAHDKTHGVRWEVSSGGEVAYETACSVVTLD